jgi:arginyl-tRNA synthetase
MLLLWEAGDAEVRALWTLMNSWVYSGFEKTYRSLGVRFDRNYYESDTYILGKAVVERGLELGVFERRADGSVWIDLSAEKLDEKLLLRKDGTSVYITQDLGTALNRFEDYGMRSMVYVVGNEQEYHFQVLFAILKRLGFDWAESLFHLSYGMVRLPEGKMKSREGTVVDADELLEEMVNTARSISEELGKTDGMEESEKEALYKMLGDGALKYFILKVDPAKDMLFNPKESIDFDGHTGPFIQYAHARIRSLERKARDLNLPVADSVLPDSGAISLIRQLDLWSGTLEDAATGYNPALVANYAYDLTKLYNTWYQHHSILNNPEPALSAFRLKLSSEVARTLRKAMGLLGIECPERM